MKLGELLRKFREQKGLLLREVAAELKVDTALISKMERGEKNIKREHLKGLSRLYQVQEKQLITFWLADKIKKTVDNEPWAEDALKMVVKEMKKFTYIYCSE